MQTFNSFSELQSSTAQSHNVANVNKEGNAQFYALSKQASDSVIGLFQLLCALAQNEPDPILRSSLQQLADKTIAVAEGDLAMIHGAYYSSTTGNPH